MNEPLAPRDASVQDIQLELIRRTTFNAMNGERIVASLLAHRDLWLAEEEDWGGMVHLYLNEEDIDRALGTGREAYGLLSIWWD